VTAITWDRLLQQGVFFLALLSASGAPSVVFPQPPSQCRSEHQCCPTQFYSYGRQRKLEKLERIMAGLEFNGAPHGVHLYGTSRTSNELGGEDAYLGDPLINDGRLRRTA